MAASRSRSGSQRGTGAAAFGLPLAHPLLVRRAWSATMANSQARGDPRSDRYVLRRRQARARLSCKTSSRSEGPTRRVARFAIELT